MKKVSTIREAAALWIEQWFHHVPASSVDNIPYNVIANMCDYAEELLLHENESFCLLGSPGTECMECRNRYFGDLDIDEMYKLWEKGKGICCSNCNEDSWQMRYPSSRGILYSPKREEDKEWIREHKAEVTKLGVYIYHSEKYGLLLGYENLNINDENNAYDLYWMPLYNLREMQWHEAEE